MLDVNESSGEAGASQKRQNQSRRRGKGIKMATSRCAVYSRYTFLPSFPLTLSEAFLLWTFPNADSARAAEYGHAPVWSESIKKKEKGERKRKKERGETRQHKTQGTNKRVQEISFHKA